MGVALISGSASATSLHCRHAAAEYAKVIKYFESEAAKARVLAEQNPLYESDLAYYASALADARACYRNLGPIATASR
jgi:hypothetical protein